MAVDDITQAVVKATITGREIIYVLHYRTTVSIGSKEAEFVGLVDALEEVLFNKIITNDLLDFTPSTVTFNEIQLRDTTDPTSGFDSLIEPPRNGTRAGESLPTQVAVLTTKKTNKIGRSFQGRNYMYAGVETDQNGGTFDGTFIDEYADWFATILPIVNAGLNFAFQLVIWSEKLLVSNDVTSVGVSTRSRTQRRRNN